MAEKNEMKGTWDVIIVFKMLILHLVQQLPDTFSSNLT